MSAASEIPFTLSDEWNRFAICEALPQAQSLPRFVTTNANTLVAPEKTGENVFRLLAEQNPALLLRYVTENVLDPADTALASEIIGELLTTPAARRALLQTLEHYSAIAREGAVYGLAHQLDRAEVMAELRKRLAISAEPSAAVREAIQDVLDVRG